jgi:hypothetical protein
VKVAFLHTSPVHVDTFNELFEDEKDVELIHRVKEDWLSEAISIGISEDLQLRVRAYLADLAKISDVVICTCSSLGPIAQQMQRADIFRIDEPMMRKAAKHTPVLLVMCLESTVAPSSALLEQAFKNQGINPCYRTLMCSQAWAHFENGDQETFGATIADAIRDDLSRHNKTGSVVLAQASMRVATKHLSNVRMPIFSSPGLAVEKAMALFGTSESGASEFGASEFGVSE